MKATTRKRRALRAAIKAQAKSKAAALELQRIREAVEHYRAHPADVAELEAQRDRMAAAAIEADTLAELSALGLECATVTDYRKAARPALPDLPTTGARNGRKRRHTVLL